MTRNPITCQGHFYFDPEDPIYQEHFPGHPVVPGSLIIYAFMQKAGAFMQKSGTFMKKAGDSAVAHDPWSIKDFRFKRFISPGRYAFHMQPRHDGRLACTLYDDGAVVVTGTL